MRVAHGNAGEREGAVGRFQLGVLNERLAVFRYGVECERGGDIARVQYGRAHIDRCLHELSPLVGLVGNRLHASACLDVEQGRMRFHDPVIHQVLRETAHAVSAHLRKRAVRVHVVHESVVARVARWLHDDNAVGSNAEAAQMRGVPINRIRVLAHTICGATAGLAGIMWLAFYAAIEKGSALGDEMFTIAACVLGGVAVTGGYGKITGVVIGALMIAFIDSAIPQMGIGNSMITEFIKGILLLVAILLNVILQRVAEKQDLARRNI